MRRRARPSTRTVKPAPIIVLTCLALTVGAGCERGELGTESWPDRSVRIGVDVIRANPLLREAIPLCREAPPWMLPDSVGPMRAGQSLAELRTLCPEHGLGWDWGPSNIPAPALAARMGDAVVIAVLNDTVPGAYVMEVVSGDLATPEGLGAGSPLDDLIDEYGEGELMTGGECVLEITFASVRGLAFMLAWPPGEVPCEDVQEIADEDALDRLPVETYVRQVTQFVPPAEVAYPRPR
jgi:hypothetical protein